MRLDNSPIESTDSFIQNLTSPSLSQMAEAYKGFVPSVEQGYENQPLVQPMQLKPEYQPQPNVQPQAPQPAAPQPVKNQANEDDLRLLAEAHQVTKNMAERERILKENYLKAEQRAAAREKELMQKDLKLAEFLHKKAIDDGDSELQNEMHSRQISLQNELTRHEIEHNNFLNQYQEILNDTPKIVDYAPTYEESEPQDHESDMRKNFRKANSWYDFESDHYNQDLVKTASEIEQSMINEYQLKNMGNYLETPYYFDDLKNRLFNKYGIQNQMAAPMQAQPNIQPVSAPINPFLSQEQNPFIPNQMGQLNQQQQMSYPTAPIQQQPQYQSAPQSQYQPQPMQQMQQPMMQQQYGSSQPTQYGPPVSPVSYNTMPAYSGMPGAPKNEAMYSQKAFEMFVNSLNPTIAPQLANLTHDQKLQLFQASIKNQGRR